MSRGRDRKTQQRAQEDNYRSMADHDPDQRAAARFQSRPYRSCSTMEYLENKGVIGVGQKHPD